MYGIGRPRLYLVIFIILLLESTVMHEIGFDNVRPNLMLIFIIFVGLFSDWREALEAGIVGGLLRGAFTTSPVGINLTIFSLCALLANYCRNKVYRESFLTQIALTFSLGLFFNILFVFIERLTAAKDIINVDIQLDFASLAFRISLYTALIAPPVFYFLKKTLKLMISDNYV
ncbi:MAG: rod shape-determining protein MreD [Candidatus Omnitrophota bacterium]